MAVQKKWSTGGKIHRVSFSSLSLKWKNDNSDIISQMRTCDRQQDSEVPVLCEFAAGARSLVPDKSIHALQKLKKNITKKWCAMSPSCGITFPDKIIRNQSGFKLKMV